MKEISNTIELLLRKGDIDVYGHISYNHFPDYFRIGREALHEIIGISDESLKELGLGFFVRQYKCKYVNQLFLGDAIKIKSKAEIDSRELYLILTQEITNNGKIIARATTKQVLVDLEKKQHIRIPRSLLEKLE